MDDKSLRERLAGRLVNRIDRQRDAARAYQPVIHATELGEIRNRLVSFRGDHLRHATELSATLATGEGEQGPVPQPDWDRSVTAETIPPDFDLGRELTALRDLESELLADSSPLQALELPAAVEALLRQHAEDIRRHVRYLDGQLTEKIWERRRAS